MPLAAERSLKAEAKEHGFKKGSRRYNAYVYGTMNKLGILNSNHAGNLGPDKILKGAPKKMDYTPTFDHVHGVHIAVVVAVIFLLVYHFRGQPFQIGLGGGKKQAPGPNGNGASSYVNTQSYGGWIATQYNSLGAYAGALNGEAN